MSEGRHSRAGGAWSAVVIVVVVVGAAPAAGAFKCTRAGDTGPSLFWSDRTVTLQRSGVGHELNADDIDGVITAAAQTWTDVDCTDIVENIGAPVNDRLVGFDWAAGVGSPENHNIVVFRNDNPDDPLDGWQHELEALAITTVTFESNQGRLLDADVEVNDAGFDFTACDDCAAHFDLSNTLTHEFGHVLGLDHSDVLAATMYPSAPEGDTSKRDLDDDDIAAICTIYPTGAPPGECYGVVRALPPHVRFEPTLCGAGGAAAPVGVLAMILFVLRRPVPRLRRK